MNKLASFLSPYLSWSSHASTYTWFSCSCNQSIPHNDNDQHYCESHKPGVDDLVKDVQLTEMTAILSLPNSNDSPLLDSSAVQFNNSC